MATEIKAPDRVPWDSTKKKIFLAGSIEMGAAPDWQSRVVEKLKNMNVILLNPRRDNWDSSWIQSINNKQFKEQVEWELRGLEGADLIILNFIRDSKSPISLLELGLFNYKNILVCCPDGFYRKGNVDIVCKRYDIPVFETIDKLLTEVKL